MIVFRGATAWMEQCAFDSCSARRNGAIAVYGDLILRGCGLKNLWAERYGGTLYVGAGAGVLLFDSEISEVGVLGYPTGSIYITKKGPNQIAP